MIRKDQTLVECRGGHTSLGDAINEVKRTAQQQSDVQFYNIYIYADTETKDHKGKVVSRTYTSRMVGVVR